MLIKEVSGEYRGYSWCIVRRNTKKRLIPEKHTLRLRFLAEEAIDVRACDRESFTEYFSLDMMYGNVGRYLGEFKKMSHVKGQPKGSFLKGGGVLMAETEFLWTKRDFGVEFCD